MICAFLRKLMSNKLLLKNCCFWFLHQLLVFEIESVKYHKNQITNDIPVFRENNICIMIDLRSRE